MSKTSKYDKEAQSEWLRDDAAAELRALRKWTEDDYRVLSSAVQWETERAEEFPSTVLLFVAAVAVCVFAWALFNSIADWCVGF